MDNAGLLVFDLPLTNVESKLVKKALLAFGSGDCVTIELFGRRVHITHIRENYTDLYTLGTVLLTYRY